MNRLLIISALTLALIAIVGVTSHLACDSGPPPNAQPALRTVRMDIAGQPFTLEVADQPDTLERGLMFRDSLPADRGMLFVFTDEKPRGFWMKNVSIPLDIIFLDARGKVVSTKSMAPQVLQPAYTSDGPAMYAIELPEGTVRRLKVRAGDQLAIPPDVRRTGGGS